MSGFDLDPMLKELNQMRSGDESSSENNSSESGSQDGGDYDETDHLIHVISGTATQEQTEAGVTQTPSEATPPTTVSVVEREFDSHGAHKGSNDSWTSGSSEESGTPIVRSDSNQAFNTAAAEGIAGHLSNDRASLVDLRQQPVVKFDEKDDDELDLDLDLDLDNVMGDVKRCIGINGDERPFTILRGQNPRPHRRQSF